jgi:hypothetical protein
MQSNPSGMTSHYFKDHHAFMRLRRGVQAIERIGGDVERGDEAEG